jgi:hypothetical protein
VGLCRKTKKGKTAEADSLRFYQADSAHQIPAGSTHPAELAQQLS